MKPIIGLPGPRRLYPCIWDYCFYELRLIRKAFEKVLSAELNSDGTATVVDFGCGDRPYEPLFEGRVSNYVAVDVEGNVCADVLISAGERLPIEDSIADLVLSAQVLEHVVDVDSYLSECYRILRPGGLLLLSTHGFWVYHPYPTDVHRWTCWGLKYDIETHGFQVESQQGCLGPLAYTTQLRLQLARGALLQLGSVATPVIGVLSTAAQVCMILEDWITPRKVRYENSAVYVIAARKPTD